MLNVGILGVGNAGNQVVAHAFTQKKSISVFALNCSESDLKTIPDGIPKALVGDGKGAGKNRDESKKFLASDVMDLINNDTMKEFITSLDIVFIVSSTGGGTGSGISLLLSQIIKKVYPTVFVITVGIISSIKEALSTHANSLEYLTELYDNTESQTYMLYDNEKYSKIPSNQMMEKINAQIVEDIVTLSGYYNFNTKYASIDDKDLMNLIKTPGRLVVLSLVNFKEKDLDDTTVEELLLKNLKTSGTVDLQKDRIVNRIGVIANINSFVSEKFDTSIPGLLDTVGSPIESFEHLYINEDRKLPNNVFVILTGCTKINDRIIKINDRIEEIMEKQNQTEDDDVLKQFNGTELNAKRVYQSNEPTTKTVNLEDIFNNFGVKLP